MSELPLLLHFRISHYNEKVRWALDLKDRHVAPDLRLLVWNIYLPPPYPTE
jgi:hypothetical protein